jgi:hypothetical protein
MNDESTLLIAYELRDAKDKLFFDSLRQRFSVERVVESRLHEHFKGQSVSWFEYNFDLNMDHCCLFCSR